MLKKNIGYLCYSKTQSLSLSSVVSWEVEAEIVGESGHTKESILSSNLSPVSVRIKDFEKSLTSLYVSVFFHKMGLRKESLKFLKLWVALWTFQLTKNKHNDCYVANASIHLCEMQNTSNISTLTFTILLPVILS